MVYNWVRFPVQFLTKPPVIWNMQDNALSVSVEWTKAM